jgi:hypothetical protein
MNWPPRRSSSPSRFNFQNHLLGVKEVLKGERMSSPDHLWSPRWLLAQPQRSAQGIVSGPSESMLDFASCKQASLICYGGEYKASKSS